ncbi:MAG: DUF4249 family protein, partial [Cytophagales bacterium]|nr:DUF4249 family protein [Cytophaga sp.]
MKYILYIVCISLLLSCNRSKEIEVPLPAFNAQPVVECYVEPGQPYRLSLFESVSYFDQPSLPVVKNALVLITHRGVTDTLYYKAIPDTIMGKLYNYVGDTSFKVPTHYNEDFTLYIKDSIGRIVTGTTTILPFVPIDTIEFKFNNDGRAASLIKFRDDPSTTDYYRYLVVVNPKLFTEKGDVTFTDEFFKTSEAVIASRSTVEPGMIYVTLLHLTKQHYDYLSSIDDARNANGN